MREQRKLERFDLSAPAWIGFSQDSGMHHRFEANVQNISSDGAFIQLADAKIHVNETLDVSILITVKKLTELFGIDDHVLLRVSGKVRRTEPEGAAIEFLGKTQSPIS